MPCEWVKLEDGTVALVRYAKSCAAKCAFCMRPHTKLCDMEIGRTLLGEPITCDAKMCDTHARQVGPNKDYCPKH